MNITDWIIVVLLLLGAIGGFRKGFVLSLAGAISSIVGIIAAYRYYPFLAKWMDEQWGLKEPLSEFLQKYLVLPQPVGQFRLEDIPLPDIGMLLENVSFDTHFKQQLLHYLDKMRNSLEVPFGITLSEIINQFLASAIVSALAFIIIWFCVDFGLRIVAALFSSVIRNTAVGQFDRLGGMIIGTLLTILVLTVFIGLLSPLLTIGDLAKPTFFSPVITAMSESRLVPCFSSLFAFLFSKFLELLPW